MIPELKPPPTTSSIIKAIGYDPINLILYIKFNTDKVYKYMDFTEGAYKKFLAAESIGRYFSKEIAPNHYYEKVDLEEKK